METAHRARNIFISGEIEPTSDVVREKVRAKVQDALGKEDEKKARAAPRARRRKKERAAAQDKARKEKADAKTAKAKAQAALSKAAGGAKPNTVAYLKAQVAALTAANEELEKEAAAQVAAASNNDDDDDDANMPSASIDEADDSDGDGMS